MKVLHVVPSFGLGGMEKIICALVNNTFDCYEHKVLALNNCTHAGNWIKDKGIRFVDFEKPNERGRFFQTLYSVLQNTKPDLLMTYNWGATDAIWLGRAAGIRCIIHNEHGFNVDEGQTTHWKRDAVRFLVYRLASKVIVVSRELENLLLQKYFLKANQITRIANGIDTSYYLPNTVNREAMRRMLGFDDNSVVVGFCGRLDPIKRLDLLFDIFAAAVCEHSQLRLLIVGDGPENKRLETLCHDRNLESHVVFAGEQEHVLSYLRAMDIFLLTSLREQMPMTVLEAMATGIPVVATKVGEIPNMIDYGLNGFIHAVDAPIGIFRKSLLALLSRPDRVRMGEAARQKILDNFEEHAMVEQYKSVIQGLAEKRGVLKGTECGERTFG
jgi:glycosyltransferase involved in cell wall biosynthesis